MSRNVDNLDHPLLNLLSCCNTFLRMKYISNIPLCSFANSTRCKQLSLPASIANKQSKAGATLCVF